MHARLLQVALAALLLACVSCEGSQDDEPPPAKDRLALVERLGRPRRLLVGLGNDLPGEEKNFDFEQASIYGLPVTLDLHYVYLSGLKDEDGPDGPGWPEYMPDGAFVTTIAESAAKKGIVPMFTLYQAAARGERRFDVLVEDDFMTKYWKGVRLLFERLRAFDQPAVVHLEPDFWGYAQRKGQGDPAKVPVLVRTKALECNDLPDDVSGMARCTIRLGRALAPKAVIGLHASGFGAEGEPKDVGKFLRVVGGAEADFVAVDTLDRDAGCFEALVDPRCGRVDGPVYWDETNAKPPTFREHFDWVRTVHEWSGLPVLWWQTPLGVPSDVPGGRPKQYRDNRVKYFFEHPNELEAAGGFGMAFGTGAPNQTEVGTDGGQFAQAVTRYYASPLPLARP